MYVIPGSSNSSTYELVASDLFSKSCYKRYSSKVNLETFQGEFMFWVWALSIEVNFGLYLEFDSRFSQSQNEINPLW